MCNKYIKKLIAASLMAGSITFVPNIYFFDYNIVSAIAHAEIQTYTGKGKAMFDFGEDDEQIVKIVKSYAQSRAEQAAREQAGVYLSNYSKTKNLHLIENEISTITNNIVNVIAVEYKKTYYNAYDIKKQSIGEVGIMYEATVKVNIDTDGIANYLKRNDNEKANLIAQNETLQQSIKQNENEFENLRKRAESAKTAAERAKIKSKLNEIDKILLFNQKNEEGNKYGFQNDYKNAILKYNEALQIWSTYLAYYNIGVCYYNLKDYNRAVSNYNKAIELNPYFDMSYNNRGYIYYKHLNHNNLAISDFNKTIELNPNNDLVYNNLAVIYFDEKNYYSALKYCNKAIKINPNNSEYYHNRGNIYYTLKQKKNALADYNKAISLNPNVYYIYFHRGIIYAMMHKLDLAIADLNKAIELNPNDGLVYYIRAMCYDELDDVVRRNADFAKAKELGVDENNAYNKVY